MAHAIILDVPPQHAFCQASWLEHPWDSQAETRAFKHSLPPSSHTKARLNSINTHHKCHQLEQRDTALVLGVQVL